MAFITGGISQTQIFVRKLLGPFVIRDCLQFFDIYTSGQAIANGTYNLAVFDWILRINQHPAE